MSVVKWKSHLPEFARELQGQQKVMLRELARVFERRLQEMFRAPKHGRVYRAETQVSFKTKGGSDVSFTAWKGRGVGKKGRAGKVHIASAPGEAPAIDTGALRQSVTHEVDSDKDGARLRLGVSTGAAQYALRLEFGGKGLEPRPAWVPTMMEMKEKMPELLARVRARMKEKADKKKEPK